MPSWSLQELMSMATARCGRRDDISASTVSYWINAAYQEVLQAQPGALMEMISVSSTTSGSSRVTLPSDCLEIINVSWQTNIGNGSGRTLRRVGIEHVDQYGSLPVGKPNEYALFSNWLELWPSPDSTYSLQIRYYASPSDMTELTNVPSIATEWRPAILYLGEAFIHEYIGNDIEGAYARARYAGYVSSLKNTEARRQSQLGGMRASLPLRRSRYGRGGSGIGWNDHGDA